MFERFTDSARQVVVQAQSEARQLGHGFIGCEHLLLAVLDADEPAAAVLREHDLTPERTRAEVIRLIGAAPPSRPADLLNVLDREALAAIGIDLDVVRSRIEATFGPDALARAVPGRRSRRRGGLRSRLRRPARNARRRPAVARNGELLDVPPARRGHIPFTPRAKKSLQLSLREAVGPGRQLHRGAAHRARPARHARRGRRGHLVGARPSGDAVARCDPRPLPQGQLTARPAGSADGGAGGGEPLVADVAWLAEEGFELTQPVGRAVAGRRHLHVEVTLEIGQPAQHGAG